VDAISGQGYVIAGSVGRAEALERVREALTAAGVPVWDAEDATADRAGLVVRAWWNDTLGFVQAEHENAVPVTVVNVPPPEPHAVAPARMDVTR
jgi:hypothetical protein